MRKALGTAILCSSLMLGSTAAASSISEVWTCQLREGKTAEEAIAAGKVWLDWARAYTGEEAITSVFVTPYVADLGSFMWVDTFPDIATWAKVSEGVRSDAGFEAIAAALNEIETCEGNRLYGVRSVSD